MRAHNFQTSGVAGGSWSPTVLLEHGLILQKGCPEEQETKQSKHLPPDRPEKSHRQKPSKECWLSSEGSSASGLTTSVRATKDTAKPNHSRFLTHSHSSARGRRKALWIRQISHHEMSTSKDLRLWNSLKLCSGSKVLELRRQVFRGKPEMCSGLDNRSQSLHRQNPEAGIKAFLLAT